MSKQFLIVANWKANISTFDQAQAWFDKFSEFNRKQIDKVEIAIAAPYPLLELVNKLTATNGLTNFSLATQDISQFPTGPYTGEVSAKLAADLGVKYSLLGHSERRKYFSETNESVEKKFYELVQTNIRPIICAQTNDELPDNIKQDKKSFELAGHDFDVMFEPFEAISKDGKSNAVSADLVSATIQEWAGKLPAGVRFLYGGSVNEQNALDYVKFVSGFVVGHASLDPEEFFKICELCSQQITS